MLGFGHILPKLRAKTPSIPSFFSKYGTPKDAFALWDVDGGGGSYLEIQRTSDDATQDFTIAQIAAEEDVTWVNSDGFSFTDDFAGGSTTGLGSNNVSLSAPETIGGETDALQVTLTGGSSFHDFRINSIESNQRYDLSFEVYIPSGNTKVDKISFADIDGLSDTYGTADTWEAVTLSNVLIDNNILRFFATDGTDISIDADGDTFSIRNLTLTQLTSTGLVKTWYDVASGVNATQSSTSVMPVIVDTGVGVSDNGKRAIESDGTQYLEITVQTVTDGFCLLLIHNGSGYPTGANVGGQDSLRLTGYQRMFINGSSYQNNDNRDNLQTLSTFNRTAGNSLSVYYNETEGTNSPFAGASGAWSLNSLFAYNRSALAWTGKIQGLLVYDEDKSSQLSDIQSAIVTEFSIP